MERINGKTSPADDAQKTARDLAVLINDYLLDEMIMKKGVPKRVKKLLKFTTDCVKRVYKIRITEYIGLLNAHHSLPELFEIGNRPTKVKDRLKAENHKKCGNALLAKKSYHSAEFNYTRAIILDPRNAVYWCNRAATRIRLQSYSLAIEDCKAALELDKRYTKALVWQGIANALTNHPGRAIRCYRKALRIEPGNEICLANMNIINKKLNHSAFWVLDPLCHYVRHLANNNQHLLKCVKKSDINREEEEHRKRREYLQKFRHETLD